MQRVRRQPLIPIPSPRERRAESGFDLVFFEAFHRLVTRVGHRLIASDAAQIASAKRLSISSQQVLGDEIPQMNLVLSRSRRGPRTIFLTQTAVARDARE